MKKIFIIFICMIVVIMMNACSVKKEDSTKDTIVEQTTSSEKVTVRGSFSVTVYDVISDYCYDDVTLNTAIVSQFQSYPFTLYVGKEIGEQLEANQVYVFTIKPVVIDYPKELLEKMKLSSLVRELPDFEIIDFRLANEDEVGMESLNLTIE